MSTPTPVQAITSAVGGLQDDLIQVGVVGLGIGAAIFALRKGWRFVKGFIS